MGTGPIFTEQAQKKGDRLLFFKMLNRWKNEKRGLPPFSFTCHCEERSDVAISKKEKKE